MSAIMDALLAELGQDQDALDRIADLVAPRLGARFARTEPRPWLNTRGAAEHLACPVGRIYDLVQLGALSPRRDGRRLLFKRDELDSYLEG